MRVSIIVPAYNAEGTLAACIGGCLAQTHPDCEVIVVDDGSTDATAQCAARFPVRVLRQPNQGPAAARNLGARAAASEVLAFTDADCVPAPDWLSRLLDGFADQGVVAVGGTYANANPHGLLSGLIHAEILYRHQKFAAEVDFLGSYNLAVRRSAFEAAGGFDESFRAASAEDNDLSYRLSAHGRLRFDAGAVVAHHHPARLGPYLNTQRRHGMWRVKLYQKHRERATRGDQYASFIEFARPPVALAIATLSLAAAAALAAGAGTATVFTAASAVLLVVIHAALARELVAGVVRHTKNSHPGVRALYATSAAALFFLRDIARAAGLLQGAWNFVIVGTRGGQRQWRAHS
ncbi:MAG: glycosyltransferase [Candidatus Hydrogenedentales bacterium]